MKVTFFNNEDLINSELLKDSSLTSRPLTTAPEPAKDSQFETIWQRVQTERLAPQKPKPRKPRKSQDWSTALDNQMLSEKYKPKHFYELVGEHRMNTEIISWLKAHRRPGLEVRPDFYFDESRKQVLAVNAS